MDLYKNCLAILCVSWPNVSYQKEKHIFEEETNMANTNKKGETATEAYARNMGEIYDKLDRIKQYLIDNGIDCREVNWGHVGSAVHINELLDELNEFIGVK
jgi:hypothetical protein